MREQRVAAFQDFTFDLASGDLARNGRRLRIQQQTALLLGLLLERAGTVVTRNELQQKLWPNGGLLDHDHAINRVVNQLRYVLRDNTRSPRFIETVPKRGYRFVAPVSFVSAPLPVPTPRIEPPAPVMEEETPLPALAGTVLAPAHTALPGAVAHRNASPFRRHPYIWLLAGVATVALVSSVALLGLHHRHAAPVAHVRLGIAPFQTSGPGSEQIAENFRLDLADALSQLPVVEIRATHSLGNIGRDSTSIRSLSQTFDLDMLLLGKFSVRDNLCTVQFELVRVSDAVHLASFQYQGSREELPVMRDKLQRDVFQSLHSKSGSVQQIRGNAENPQAYRESLQARERTGARKADGLQQALMQYNAGIARDANFAQAYTVWQPAT